MPQFDNISDVTAERISQLISDEINENASLEYKRNLSIKNDSERKEFLADVSAMANVVGGTIIYGVSEKKDASGKNTGVPNEVYGIDTNLNLGEVVQKLDHLIRDGLEPRVQGITIEQLDISTKTVVVVQIPKSWSSPHMVTLSGSFRFFGRNNSGKYPMSVSEIGNSFVSVGTVREKIERFHKSRCLEIAANEGALPLAKDSYFVLHLIPFTSVAEPKLVNLAVLESVKHQALPINAIGSGGADYRYNIDGIACYSGIREPEQILCYTQLYRNQIIEAVDSYYFSSSDDSKLIASTAFENDVINSLKHYLNALRELGSQPPIAMAAAMLNVRGHDLHLPRGVTRRRRKGAFDRPNIYLPIQVLENLDGDPATILKPLFDAYWNAAGFDRCHNYDKNGIRNEPSL